MTTTTTDPAGPLALVVTADGRAWTERLPRSATRQLTRLNELVGGYIEAVAVAGGGWVAYINEDGKRHGLPANFAADSMVRALGFRFQPGDHLVGTAVFLGSNAPRQSTEQDVPERIVALAAAAELTVERR